MSALDLADIARACGGEYRNGQALVPGPGHSHKDRSVSVRLTDNGEDIVVFSFAGDDPLRCKDWVRETAGLPGWEPNGRGPDPLSKMQARARPNGHGPKPVNDDARANAPVIVLPVSDDAPPAPTRHPNLGEPSATWAYRDETGALLGHICRFDPEEGRKEFCPLTMWRVGTTASWKWKSWPKPRPLYGLDRLAQRPNASVILCEGEKSADAAQSIFPNSVAVTSPGGSKAASTADWRPLAGRPVMVWPDADEPGAVYAQAVTRELAAIGAGTVTLVDVTRVAGTAPSGESREPPKGWDAAEGLAEGWQPEDLAALVLGGVKRAEDAPQFVSFGSYSMNSDGLRAEVTKGRGENATLENVWVSTAFEVLGRARDAQSREWSRWLRWRDPDGRRHEHAVPDGALQGDAAALAGDLASRGLKISRSNRNALLEYLNNVEVADRVTVVSRTGWHTLAETKVFVLPDEVMGEPAGESVVLAGAAAAPYARCGTLDDWRQGIGRLTAGHNRLVFAVSIALAGPLVELTDGEGGGVNIYGDSSKGKTTALRAAASVWGRGATDPGFVRSWRATANAQEATAATTSDTLLCLDEIGVAEGRDAASAVYQLASGVGKGRSARDGSIRTPMTWRVLVLSTGELPMAAKIAEDKQRRAYAGQAVRLLDVPADAGKGFGVFDNAGPTGDPAAFAESIKRAALESYGTAGPAFVKALAASGLDEARRMANDIVKGFIADHVPTEADSQVRRAAERLGMIAAAGELAIGFGIVPWTEGEAEAAASRALRDWIGARGGDGASEVREAVAQVRRFFEAFGDSRFEPADGTDARPVQNRVGWRRGQGDDRVWYVLPEMWKTEVCQGLDPVGTARLLAEREIIRRSSEGKFQRTERTPGGSTRVYVVTAAVFDGDRHA